MISEDEFVTLIRREIEQAQGYDADALANKRQYALDYYHGKKPEEPADGRSDIVSYDVADVVHSLMAQIMPIFTTSIVQFEANGEQDEAQAQLESDFVQRMLERYDGYDVLYSAAFDALLQGNGWIKVDVKTDRTETSEDYAELDEVQIAVLSQPRADNERVLIDDKGDKGITITRVRTDRRLEVRCIAPDVMLFSNAWDQFEFQELRFVGERILYTESDLKGMGIPAAVIDELPDATEDYWPAIAAREGPYQDQTQAQRPDTQDAEILKECFDCHIRVDVMENGESELRRVLISGDELLLDEPAPFIPYVTGSPVPMPHRIEGQGMYEVMAAIQDSKTSVLRKFIDALEVNVLGRYEAVEGKVNMDDLLSGRVSGVVRTRAPGSVNPLHATQAPADAVAGLNYLDTVREQRGGASLDMNDADRQLMQSSAAAATGMMNSHEAMAGWYARNLVRTMLKPLFYLTHEAMRYWMPGNVGAKIRGKWVQTNPAQWPQRQNIECTAGMTTQERANKISGYTQVLSQQQQWFQMGYDGIIVDGGKIFQAAAEWIRAADLGDPSEYLIDPDSPEAQQAAQQKAQQAQAQEQEMKQMQAGMIQMQRELEQQKLELDKYKHDSDLRFKYYDANLDADVKEAEMTADALTAITKQPGDTNGAGPTDKATGN
jgi:hypothetical protein